VNQVVAEFCATVAREPLAFFSECDLQDMLAIRLRRAFPKLISTSVHRGPRETTTTCYRTGMVHREYGAGNSRRLDIAVLDKKHLSDIEDCRLRTDGNYLKPRFGFELGTELVGDAAKHLENDITKLNDQVSERGYIIHVFRDFTLADNGTERRRKKEKAIEGRFRSHVAGCSQTSIIRVVAFVLRIAHANHKIRGKCEMFRGDSREWVKTNLKAVREAVLEELQRTIL
jgi:hypothetical protein